MPRSTNSAESAGPGARGRKLRQRRVGERHQGHQGLEQPDGGFAGVWLFLVTAPTSLLFSALPGVLPFAGVAVGAAVRALALGRVGGAPVLGAADPQEWHVVCGPRGPRTVRRRRSGRFALVPGRVPGRVPGCVSGRAGTAI
ncbi:SCO4225 family membrane protein (plasmid) [Streptomyces sp. QTS137]